MGQLGRLIRAIVVVYTTIKLTGQSMGRKEQEKWERQNQNWTTQNFLPNPCVPEKKLLSIEISELGVVICDRHHDSAVD